MFVLKLILEAVFAAALIYGFIHEDAVAAWEREVLAKLRGETDTEEETPKHSATYMASREEKLRVYVEKERIANGAAYARREALRMQSDAEVKRVA